MTPQDALKKVIDIVGSQDRLAREIGGHVKQAHISYWLRQAKSVPAEYCPRIERIVRSAVRCEELNPDVDWWVLRMSKQWRWGTEPGGLTGGHSRYSL